MTEFKPEQTYPHTVDRYAALQDALVTAEQTALSYFNKRSDLFRTSKSLTDFVTEADHAVESCIRRELAKSRPNDVIVGEEMGGEPSDDYWLVDPIDGTSNFLSGLPIWAISIAYVESGYPVLGGVAIPMLGRTLIGGQNFPVTETGRSFFHTGAEPIVFGVGGNEFWPKPCRALIEEVLAENGKSSVSLGSCATSLAFAAAGELAGYAEACVGFWDIAAGIALCEAAGLAVTFTSAPGPHSSNIAVGPADFQSEIHAAMLTYVSEEND